MLFTRTVLSLGATLAFSGIAVGQTNFNNNCGLRFEGPSRGSTLYYDAAETDDVGIYVTSYNLCDAGSYGVATLQQILPNGNFGNSYACSNYNLDGNRNLVNCPGVSRGTLPPGRYWFFLYYVKYSNGASGIFADYSVTHDQVTTTAPTPTVTATTTPTSMETATEYTTNTETEFSARVTVTTPAVSETNTFTETPTSTRTKTTSAFTVHSTSTSFVVSATKTTTRGPCKTRTLRAGRATSTNKAVKVKPRSWAGRLHIRAPNAGEGIYGGDLTLTITPPAVLTTSTADATTSTITQTLPTDTTVTEPNPTPTETVYEGTAVIDTTTTLPQRTKTRTIYQLTTEYAETVSTITATYTRTIRKLCPTPT